MAHFHDITQAEIEAFLLPQGFQAIKLPNTYELVYGKAFRYREFPISLRVYTGINPTGHSREVGQDAIRVNAWIKLPNGDIRKLGGSKRVHRVEGWRGNLANRIDHWQDGLQLSCPKCGMPMALREQKANKKNKFYGCVSYPACTATLPYKS